MRMNKKGNLKPHNSYRDYFNVINNITISDLVFHITLTKNDQDLLIINNLILNVL